MPYVQRDPAVRDSDYTCQELARKWNLSIATIRNKVSLGLIPSYKVGGARRIPAEWVHRAPRADPDTDSVVNAVINAAPKLTAAQRQKLAKELARPVKPRDRVGGNAARRRRA
jgi:excisionase family DNA binding protein